MHDQDPYYPSKGPQDKHWARCYNGIGLRKDNWRMYSNSPEHHQCQDCGYYWPTEGVGGFLTAERMGRCWQCWMHVTRPDELHQIKQQASQKGIATAEPTKGLRKFGG